MFESTEVQVVLILGLSRVFFGPFASTATAEAFSRLLVENATDPAARVLVMRGAYCREFFYSVDGGVSDRLLG